jgi:hypothetical protein
LVVKIVDMGIAKIRDPSDPMAGPSTTIIGTFKGSPAYAAPEVVNHDGIGQGPDHRADIYSLGVILYYLVCRQLPFTVDMNMERAIDALLVKVGAGRFTQPIKVDSSIPESLNDIIVRTMSKDPDDRYQTVGELRQALLDFAAAQGISIHRRVEDSATSRADQVAAPVIVAVPVPDESIVAPMQRVRRWPRAAIAVAAASLALGAVGVGAWKFARREPLAEEVVNEAPYTVRITTDPPGALVEMEEINRHGERWRSPLGSAPTTIQEIGNKTIVVRHDGYFSAYLQTSPENNTFKIALEPLPK